MKADPAEAERLYQKQCAYCHDAATNPRIPLRSALNKMAPAAILRTLTTGVMAEHGARMAQAERELVANWLGTAARVDEQRSIPNPCTAPSKGAAVWENWGNGLDNRRFQSSKAAGLTVADVPGLRLRWAFGFPEASMVRSQPAVHGGRLFAGSQDGTVYALDARSGCVHWSSNVGAEVRSAITVATLPSGLTLFFGDSAGKATAMDAASGRILWQLQTDPHPATRVTGTPVYWDGRVFIPVSSSEEASALQPGYACCTFRGSLIAAEATTGKLLWRAYTIPEPPTRKVKTKRGTVLLGPSGAAIWSTPTIDPKANAVYVTTGDNYTDPVTDTSDAVLAFDLTTGKRLWSRQFTKGDAMNLSCWHPDKTNCPDSDGPDFDFGAAPILVSLGNSRRALILGQKSGIAYGVDPDRKGRLLWQTRAGEGGIAGGIQWGSATDASKVYVAISDMGMEQPAKRVPGGPRYEIDPKRGGGLIALRLEDGKQVWKTPSPGCDDRKPCSPAQPGAVTAIEGVVFSGSVDGHVRAYAANDGRILWQYDTAHNYDTVNGVPARGGSLDVGGPVVAGGMLYVNSGYMFLGGMPGNVLLAFSADEASETGRP
jgi:polyvinyl alcohol dehydrogenase (cytochrome)